MMENAADRFIKRLRRLGVPLERVVVIGSGVLAIHGIREARDVDLVVPPDVFVELEKSGEWHKGFIGSSSYALERGSAEIWVDWSTDGTGHPTYEDLLSDSEIIDGVRFVTLEYLEKCKAERGSEKDMEDIRKIHEYRENC